MSDSPDTHPAAERLRNYHAFFDIPFTPVPVKPRHDGWTPARQRGFIDRLCVTGCVARSARAVGKSPQSAYRLRDHPQAASFAAAWGRALDAGQSHQIDVGLDRALNGQSFPIVRAGVCVGERRRYDNRLAMTVLAALDRREARSGDTNAQSSTPARSQPSGDSVRMAPLKQKGFSRQNTSPSSPLTHNMRPDRAPGD